MVGDEDQAGGEAAELTAGLRAGYDAAAADWADGPGRLYALLARVLVASAPRPVSGARVLDLGTGSGAAARAALAAGAHQVVGADLSVGMLRLAGRAFPSVAANAIALPFRDRSFDLVVAAFSLNHLADVEAGLAEARRVGAGLVASVFAPGWTHPARDAVDEAVRGFGYDPPDWYVTLMPRSGSPTSDQQALAERATAAGFGHVRVRTATVRTDLESAAELASWRLGLAQFAPFMRSLDAPDRAEVQRAAEQAVAAAGGGPLVVSMTVLAAR
jgi:ubiquinone/menaquinone biosynthesis C-methylase UbiE